MEKPPKLNKFLSILQCKIARRFSFYIVSFGLVISLIVSSIYVYGKYRSDIAGLNAELSRVEQSVKNSLSQSLWQLNFNALNILINDLLTDKDIVYAALFDENGKLLIKKGAKIQRYAIKRSIPLYHNYNGRKIYIGKLVYIATTRDIYEKDKKSALNAIAAITVFFIFLSLAIIFFLWHLIVKHLVTIKNYTDNLRVDGYNGEEINDLVLKRPVVYDEKGDELSDLVTAINKMHRKIVESYRAIEFQSLHDELTGLPNKRMINRMIANVIERCRKSEGYSALFYIDLDQFKLLNDSMGHTVGNKILLEVTRRLTTISGKDYMPARIGGDEFLVLRNKIDTDMEEVRAEATDFAIKILSRISESIMIDNTNLKVTACIGIALFGSDVDAEVVIKRADIALYHAKQKGRNQFTFFVSNMQEATDRRLQLEQLLDVAVEKDLLFMNYQPKYDHNQRIYSAESLVRLKDESGGIVSPAEFIPVAEESGLIVKIGNRIIEKVFEFIGKNRLDIERSNIKSIAINISPTQYSSPGFVDKIIAYTEQFEINPNLIMLEITEEVVAGSIDDVLDVMKQLKEYGFHFSIDDFGTGYSSLRYLKNFPLDELKIDKSFVDDVVKDDKALAIVKTIIDMAYNLKLDVVAEGVENTEQLHILRRNGCKLYQGFLFSKPLMENDFLDKLKTNYKVN